MKIIKKSILLTLLLTTFTSAYPIDWSSVASDVAKWTAAGVVCGLWWAYRGPEQCKKGCKKANAQQELVDPRNNVRDEQVEMDNLDLGQALADFNAKNPQMEDPIEKYLAVERRKQFLAKHKTPLMWAKGLAGIAACGAIAYKSNNELVQQGFMGLASMVTTGLGLATLASSYMPQQKNEVFQLAKSNTSFSDLAGEIPEEIRSIIQISKNGRFYDSRFNIGLPRGIMLYGPPGTGKTMLARAIASEMNSYFMSIKISDIFSSYYSESAKQIDRIFKTARTLADKGIMVTIFIDEIDALGNRANSGDSESKKVINELLSQMDGFEEVKNVLVIGATNYIDNIDQALLRTGRFDHKIKVDLPDKEKRLQILNLYVDKYPSVKNVENREQILKFIAENTENFCCADLKQLVIESVQNTLGDKRLNTTETDMLLALKNNFVSKRDLQSDENKLDSKILTAIQERIEEANSSVLL